MFLTVTIPTHLYREIVHSTVEHYEDLQPDRRLAAEDLSEDKLGSMQGSYARLGAVAAVLAQFSWTTVPREIAITAEGRLLRSILTNAINNALLTLTRALGPTITPTCDIDQYALLNNQITDLLTLIRTVQHDPDDVTAGGS